MVMKGAVIAGPQKLELVDMPIPEIGDEEVLIRVTLCGICHSEFPLWKEGTLVGRRIGHEPVGIVEAVGRLVTNVKAGDRVTGLFLEAFAEYAKTHYSNVVVVPESLSDEEAMGEPLSCLMSGADRTQVSLGDSVAIIGSGFMGLGFLQLLKLKGAAKIIGIDIRKEGLENARRFGADEAYLPQDVPKDYIVDEWNDQMFVRGADVVAEVSGSQPGLDLAGKMTRVHGILSVVGYHQNGLRSVDMQLWNWKGITVINAHERRNNYHINYMKAALKLIESKRLDIKNLLTHEYKFTDINKAFEDAEKKPQGYIKGFLRI
jgi:threonine dehydrogenase-like Zn-dependent dehydrogenase